MHAMLNEINIKFLFTEPPQIQPFQFPPEIKKGDTASIVCAVMRGTSPFTFSWFRNGKSLKNNERVNQIFNNKVSTLVIESVDESSSGNYTCVVNSKSGRDNYTASLKVRGKKFS